MHLQSVVKGLTITEDFLSTQLIEVGGILNTKPLSYVSSYVTDPDPVTPTMHPMERQDSSLL